MTINQHEAMTRINELREQVRLLACVEPSETHFLSC